MKPEDVPEELCGLCSCGCGEPAPIARWTDRREGWVKGQPKRFIQGHAVAAPLAERIKALSTITETGCWEWQANMSNSGYGQLRVTRPKRRTLLAHRASYEAFIGPIPDGLQIDHLCRNKRCCNPEHLEPVTHAENMRRRDAAITSCPAGHPYDDKNTYRDRRGKRHCRACSRDRAAAKRAA